MQSQSVFGSNIVWFFFYVLLGRSLHTYFDYGLFPLPIEDRWLTTDVTSQQAIRTLPEYLILPLVFPCLSCSWFMLSIFMRTSTIGCFHLFIMVLDSIKIISNLISKVWYKGILFEIYNGLLVTDSQRKVGNKIRAT